METETIEVGRQKKGLPIDDLGRRRRGHYDGPQIDNYDKFCECSHAVLCIYLENYDKREVVEIQLKFQIRTCGRNTSHFRLKSKQEVCTTTTMFTKRLECKRTHIETMHAVHV